MHGVCPPEGSAGGHYQAPRGKGRGSRRICGERCGCATALRVGTGLLFPVCSGCGHEQLSAIAKRTAPVAMVSPQRGKSLKELAYHSGTDALLKVAGETPLEVAAAATEEKKPEHAAETEGAAAAARACCGGMWC